MHDELCINNWESALGTELCNCEYIEHIRADEREKAAQRVNAFAITPHPNMETADWLDALDAAVRGGERA